VKARLSTLLGLLAAGCGGGSSAPPGDTSTAPECRPGQYILGDACAPLVIGGPPRSEGVPDATIDGPVALDAAVPDDAAATLDATFDATASDGGRDASADDAGTDADAGSDLDGAVTD
jgi:hypothetical protein